MYKDLLLAIILSGVKDKDEEYFNSESMKKHAELLGVDPKFVREKGLESIRNGEVLPSFKQLWDEIE